MRRSLRLKERSEERTMSRDSSPEVSQLALRKTPRRNIRRSSSMEVEVDAETSTKSNRRSRARTPQEFENEAGPSDMAQSLRRSPRRIKAVDLSSKISLVEEKTKSLGTLHEDHEKGLMETFGEDLTNKVKDSQSKEKENIEMKEGNDENQPSLVSICEGEGDNDRSISDSMVDAIIFGTPGAKDVRSNDVEIPRDDGLENPRGVDVEHVLITEGEVVNMSFGEGGSTDNSLVCLGEPPIIFIDLASERSDLPDGGGNDSLIGVEIKSVTINPSTILEEGSASKGVSLEINDLNKSADVGTVDKLNSEEVVKEPRMGESEEAFEGIPEVSTEAAENGESVEAVENPEDTVKGAEVKECETASEEILKVVIQEAEDGESERILENPEDESKDIVEGVEVIEEEESEIASDEILKVIESERVIENPEDESEDVVKDVEMIGGEEYKIASEEITEVLEFDGVVENPEDEYKDVVKGVEEIERKEPEIASKEISKVIESESVVENPGDGSEDIVKGVEVTERKECEMACEGILEVVESDRVVEIPEDESKDDKGIDEIERKESEIASKEILEVVESERVVEIPEDEPEGDVGSVDVNAKNVQGEECECAEPEIDAVESGVNENGIVEHPPESATVEGKQDKCEVIVIKNPEYTIEEILHWMDDEVVANGDTTVDEIDKVVNRVEASEEVEEIPDSVCDDARMESTKHAGSCEDIPKNFDVSGELYVVEDTEDVEISSDKVIFDDLDDESAGKVTISEWNPCISSESAEEITEVPETEEGSKFEETSRETRNSSMEEKEELFSTKKVLEKILSASQAVDKKIAEKLEQNRISLASGKMAAAAAAEEIPLENVEVLAAKNIRKHAGNAEASKEETLIEKPQNMKASIEKLQKTKASIEKPQKALASMEKSKASIEKPQKALDLIEKTQKAQQALIEKPQKAQQALIEKPQKALASIEKSQKALASIKKPQKVLASIEKPQKVMVSIGKPQKVLALIEKPQNAQQALIEKPQKALASIEKPKKAKGKISEIPTKIAEKQSDFPARSEHKKPHYHEMVTVDKCRIPYVIQKICWRKKAACLERYRRQFSASKVIRVEPIPGYSSPEMNFSEENEEQNAPPTTNGETSISAWEQQGSKNKLEEKLPKIAPKVQKIGSWKNRDVIGEGKMDDELRRLAKFGTSNGKSTSIKNSAEAVAENKREKMMEKEWCEENSNNDEISESTTDGPGKKFGKVVKRMKVIRDNCGMLHVKTIVSRSKVCDSGKIPGKGVKNLVLDPIAGKRPFGFDENVLDESMRKSENKSGTKRRRLDEANDEIRVGKDGKTCIRGVVPVKANACQTNFAIASLNDLSVCRNDVANFKEQRLFASGIPRIARTELEKRKVVRELCENEENFKKNKKE